MEEKKSRKVLIYGGAFLSLLFIASVVGTIVISNNNGGISNIIGGNEETISISLSDLSWSQSTSNKNDLNFHSPTIVDGDDRYTPSDMVGSGERLRIEDESSYKQISAETEFTPLKSGSIKFRFEQVWSWAGYKQKEHIQIIIKFLSDSSEVFQIKINEKSGKVEGIMNKKSIVVSPSEKTFEWSEVIGIDFDFDSGGISFSYDGNTVGNGKVDVSSINGIKIISPKRQPDRSSTFVMFTEFTGVPIAE